MKNALHLCVGQRSQRCFQLPQFSVFMTLEKLPELKGGGAGTFGITTFERRGGFPNKVSHVVMFLVQFADSRFRRLRRCRQHVEENPLFHEEVVVEQPNKSTEALARAGHHPLRQLPVDLRKYRIDVDVVLLKEERDGAGRRLVHPSRF